ncbi:helix-turn-helix domain-containing protein [Proteiniphilum sp. UBA5384]|uniref:helix-turn-helix domain-containing protein n=1 Tax=Proteiniphilum sp. UBA5384 TaxID=1947279 RepID=UPI0025D6EA96|nr:helix-turn-helix transcriptional regulator [Proteiniphilum sp. UBA5384]
MNIMQTKKHTNNHQIVDYDAVLDAKFGKAGTQEREDFRREAYAYYMGQIIYNARKSEKVTQSELASRIGVNKSYISKIENGDIEPGSGTFYRIIDALGLRFEITKKIC